MPELQDGAQSKVVKHRRRKPIKSCSFCRRRKLKCDQAKPRCSTCTKRGIIECTYGHSNDYSLDGQQLLQKVRSLEQKLQVAENLIKTSGTIEIASSLESHLPGSEPSIPSTSPIAQLGPETTLDRSEGIEHSTRYQHDSSTTTLRDLDDVGIRNPYCNLRYIQCKYNGRFVHYGPTALKSFIHNSPWKFLKVFSEFWAKLKKARNMWKQKNKFSMLHELHLGEAPFAQGASNLIESTVKELPTYEQVSNCISIFFRNSECFSYNNILDESKTITDFYRGFVKSHKVLPNGERQIKELIPDFKQNYYKVGIILMIVSIVHYGRDVPTSVERFLIYLSGLSCKIQYVEWLQFLFLRCIHREIYLSTGGDNVHLTNFVDQLCGGSILLGLNHNIKELYQGKENMVGNLETLKNLWVWILYLDSSTSFQLGKPQCVNELMYDMKDESCGLIDHSDTFMGCLRRYLLLVRPMLQDILNPRVKPNLNEYIEALIQFVEQEFPPIKTFTDSSLKLLLPIEKIPIYSDCICLTTTFYSLQLMVGDGHTVHIKNGIFETALVGIGSATKFINECFAKDKEFFPERAHSIDGKITPYLAYGLFFVHDMVIRTLTLFYSACYRKLTFSENKLFLLLPNCQFEKDIDLSSLRANKNVKLNMATMFDVLNGYFDSWEKPNEVYFSNKLCKSMYVMITVSLEKICRRILQEVIRCRTKAENNLIAHMRLNTVVPSHLTYLNLSLLRNNEHCLKDTLMMDPIMYNVSKEPPSSSDSDNFSGTATHEALPEEITLHGTEQLELSPIDWEGFLNSTTSEDFFHGLPLFDDS